MRDDNDPDLGLSPLCFTQRLVNFAYQLPEVGPHIHVQVDAFLGRYLLVSLGDLGLEVHPQVNPGPALKLTQSCHDLVIRILGHLSYGLAQCVSSFSASWPKIEKPNTSPGHRQAAPCVAT